MDSHVKHFLHVCFFFTYMGLTTYLLLKPMWTNSTDQQMFFTDNYFLIIVDIIRFIVSIASTGFFLLNFAGFLFYNAFENEVTLKSSPVISPFICFRTVTRGHFPNLVRTNVNRNIDTCLREGLKNFVIEIVTDKEMNLPKADFLIETVVPSTYRTKTCIQFKGRALQYALEQNFCSLNDDDWIVHLDEETLLTGNSVRGILNFITENKSDLGQGLITYANENVVNWMTTILDFYRIADDMGTLKMQMKCFHKLVLIWKGSFMVCRMGMEKDVSFDLGPESSVSEDVSFGLVAASKGYRFDYIEGEMLEKAAFTLWDFFLQKQRWLLGGYFVAINRRIPMKNKVLVLCAMFCIILNFVLPIFSLFRTGNIQFWSEFLSALCFILAIYLHLFGLIKSFSLYPNVFGFWTLVLSILAAVPTTVVITFMYFLGAIVALISGKIKFHVVQKGD